MYDKLVKSLRICEGACNKECVLYNSVQVDGDTCQNRLCAMAADAIEEVILTAESYRRSMEAWADVAANAQPGWILVNERLPKEDDGMVFVLMPDVFPYNSKQPFANCEQDRRIEMAHYSEHSGTWYFGDCGAVGGKDPIA